MYHLYKKLSTKILSYIYNFFPTLRNSTRHSNTVNIFYSRTDYFTKSFFLSVVTEWDKLDPYTSNFSSEGIFRNALLQFVGPVVNKIYSINDPMGLKLLTIIHLGLSL